ncbi:MAG: CvpA family protein [Pseudomonadota bacterium]|nr:CvpA family protein [Pseudomonadota bacterium]
MENNIIDIVLIIFMLLSGILALSQGFIREILSLLGWVVAFINLKIFMPESTQYVSVFIENKPLANLITISIIFVSTLILWRIFSIPLEKLFKKTSIGYIDRFLGFIFGIFRIFLIVGIVYMVIILPIEKENRPNYMQESKISPFIENLAIFLRKNLQIIDISLDKDFNKKKDENLDEQIEKLHFLQQ